MEEQKFDFSGWATKNNLVCSDGRIIRHNAFEECDGITVPLVWNHQHNKPEEVLGHALLENRDEGVYAYCSFNDTDAAQNAKLLVQHGDVNQLSIYANKLKQQGCNVIHGIIREVSLVLAGANPGAYIDSVIMHGDDSYEEGTIYTDEIIDYIAPLSHSDNTKKGEEEMAEETKKPETKNDGEETVADALNTLSESQKKAVFAIIGQAIEDASKKSSKETEKESSNEPAKEKTKEPSKDELEHSKCGSDKDEKELEHSKCGSDENKKKLEHSKEEPMEDDSEEDDSDETVQDVFDTFTEKQKKVVYALIGQALKDKEAGNKNEGGENNMKHNVFENETNEKEVLSHAEMAEIMDDAKRNGSLKDAVLQHGIENIDYLFPDAQAIDKVPGFIKREDTWVTEIMNTVHHTPFSRIKSVFADITEADARAKGYIKGNLKTEEVFTLLKRVTTPTTIYKKQKLDRDDVIDITDFDVVAWLKTEMRMMLDEEIARALLVGDGRSSSSNDKINEQNVRPIWTDDDVYTVKATVDMAADATDDAKAKAFIKAAIKSRKNYKGSGNPTMFISEDMLTNCLLLEDTNQRVIYDTIEKLATALRVKKIVPVPVMEGLKRTVGAKTHELAGIYVNMADYNIGADKGGAVNMFDDFDIDYNQQKYLIETRCSGALTVPFSAVAIEFVSTTAEEEAGV